MDTTIATPTRNPFVLGLDDEQLLDLAEFSFDQDLEGEHDIHIDTEF